MGGGDVMGLPRNYSPGVAKALLMAWMPQSDGIAMCQCDVNGICFKVLTIDLCGANAGVAIGITQLKVSL